MAAFQGEADYALLVAEVSSLFAEAS